jgi:hypothetical protein
MRTKPKSYPYPVLSPLSDDVTPAVFDTTLEVMTTPGAYVLKVRMTIQNTTLLTMIAAGDAHYSLHVECQNNFYRELFRSQDPSQRIEIPADELAGTVEVSSFVTATRDFPAYRVDGAHADYAGRTFIVRTGDVLAVAKSFTFDAEKEQDALKKISSIMQIQPSDSVADGYLDTEFDNNDRITVFLSKADHEKYGLLRETPGIRGVVIQAISLPVLIEAVAIVREQQSGESEGLPRWQRRVRLKLAELDPHWETSERTDLHFAQLLLANPFGRFVGELLKITDKD